MIRARSLIGLLFLGCAARSAPPATAANEASVPPEIRAAVDAPDRTDDDRKLDRGRKPAEFLAFIGVRPGMRVAELGAGRGYTTELLARVVGPSGVVFAQNAPAMLQRIGDQPWVERLARPANQRVVRVDRPFDDPLPPEATNLDLVLINALYHDTVWLKVDRAKMNAQVFAALRSGGHYVVSDSSAKAGTRDADAERLHRIDEQLVRDEVLAAGFKLESESPLLRNPNDARDWNASPRAAGERRGTSDRFLLKFVKP